MTHTKFTKPSFNSHLFTNFGWKTRTIWDSQDDPADLADLTAGLLDPLGKGIPSCSCLVKVAISFETEESEESEESA